jgi:ABC-type cobalt transport system substrate-binding protein
LDTLEREGTLPGNGLPVPDGRLLRSPETEQIYLVSNGQLRPFARAETLKNLGYSSCRAQFDPALETYERGPAIGDASGSEGKTALSHGAKAAIPLGSPTLTGPGTPVVADATTPTPTYTLPSGSVTFTWTAATGCMYSALTGYWLDVGYSRGNGGISSGYTASTSRTVTIPASGSGNLIWVRLWYQCSGVWQTPVDYVYGAPSGIVLLPALTGPGTPIEAPPGSNPTPTYTLPSGSVTFTWSAALGCSVTGYWLDVGYSRGNGGISSGFSSTTSRTVVIPSSGSGTIIWVRLWYQCSGVWQTPIDYVYWAPQVQIVPPALSGPGSPVVAPPGSNPVPTYYLPAGSVTFTWAAATGCTVTGYWLDVGYSRGNGGISSGFSSTTSRTVTIPSSGGTIIWVRLWYQCGGVWQTPIDYVYWAPAVVVVAPVLNGPGTPVPAPAGSNPAPTYYLPAGSVTFTWTPATGCTVTGYWLDVGYSRGNGGISSGFSSTTSRTVTIPSSGGTIIWVRLWYQCGGVWQTPIDYVYWAPVSSTCPAGAQDLTFGTVNGYLPDTNSEVWYQFHVILAFLPWEFDATLTGDSNLRLYDSNCQLIASGSPMAVLVGPGTFYLRVGNHNPGGIGLQIVRPFVLETTLRGVIF